MKVRASATEAEPIPRKYPMTMKMFFRRRLSPRAGAASRAPEHAGVDRHAIEHVPPATNACTASASQSRPRPDSPNAPSILHWRSPWRACLAASWMLGTVTAPSFWLTGVLLAINPRSDHPAFWASLMGIVAFVNATTIVRINQRQHRREYACRETLARHYQGMSQRMGAVLFLACGWGSGFLPDLTLSAMSGHVSAAAVAAAVMWNVLLAWLFGLSSFTHAGAVHARIGFVYQTRPPQA